MTAMPAVSVVMPVYNEARFVGVAIQSILEQTFSDFELVVVDNGSSDDSALVLSRLTDSRIRVFRNEKNLGSAAASNRAVRESTAPLIARMDADDIAFPRRLEKQVEAFNARPTLGLLGGQVDHFQDGVSLRGRFAPRALTPVGIAWQSLFESPCIHSTLMFRRECFDTSGGYDERFQRSSDFALISSIRQRYPVANLPDVLVRFRHGDRTPLRDSSYNMLVRDLIGRNARSLLEPESAGARLQALVSAWPDFALMLRNAVPPESPRAHEQLPEFLLAFAARVRELHRIPAAVREVENDARFKLCSYAWEAVRSRRPSAPQLVRASVVSAPLFSSIFAVRQVADAVARRAVRSLRRSRVAAP
jgi:glycosyltransferase involved in cell wall biosynthesis